MPAVAVAVGLFLAPFGESRGDSVCGRSGEATFVQEYRSDRHRDTVGKVLTLVVDDGEWRILSETVE